MKIKKGIFITIEGGEGTGKTTQTKFLIKYLVSRGYEVVLSQEPGATRVGRVIRRVLLDPKHTEIDKFCELFLYMADRAQHVKEVIIPAIKEGKVVISDRFMDATVAYQGFGRGISRDLITALNQIATRGTKPDLTICIDLGARKGLKRAGVRSSYDRVESEGIDFHSKVRRGYLSLAKKEPRRIKLINGTGSPHKISLTIKKHIDGLIAGRGVEGKRTV